MQLRAVHAVVTITAKGEDKRYTYRISGYNSESEPFEEIVIENTFTTVEEFVNSFAEEMDRITVITDLALDNTEQ